MSDILLFFIKYPVSGRVKTRLGNDTGFENAALLYKAFVEDMLQIIDNAKIKTIICYDTFTSLSEYEKWLGKRDYMPQQGDDLGEKMERSFKSAWNLGYERGVLIGSDLPGLEKEIIKQAFAELRRKQSCIGPAVDGGYYLIGFNRESFAQRTFRNIEWSTPEVFSETLAKLNEENISSAILPIFNDIDTLSDLTALLANSSTRLLCPETSKVYKQICRKKKPEQKLLRPSI